MQAVFTTAARLVKPESLVMNICILARKRLSTNTRILRQTRALGDKGHSVTVVCLEKPHDRLLEISPKTEFIEVKLEHLLHKLLRIIHPPVKVITSVLLVFYTYLFDFILFVVSFVQGIRA